MCAWHPECAPSFDDDALYTEPPLQRTVFRGQEAFDELNRRIDEAQLREAGKVAFDFDDTLRSAAHSALPVLQQLKKAGHKIVVLTARKPHKWAEVYDWLKKRGISDVEVTNVKPRALVYIDDRAVRWPTSPAKVKQAISAARESGRTPVICGVRFREKVVNWTESDVSQNGLLENHARRYVLTLRKKHSHNQRFDTMNQQSSESTRKERLATMSDADIRNIYNVARNASRLDKWDRPPKPAVLRRLVQAWKEMRRRRSSLG